MAAFLTPDGFARPALTAVLWEGRVVREAGRYAWREVTSRGRERRSPYVGPTVPRAAEPVLLVPGFMAGDGSLALMSRSLRKQGFRTYRSAIQANVGCTNEAVARLEERLEDIAQHRGSKVRIVGHSLGGMLARGLAASRPDLVSGVVTLGSPVLAPGAHHLSLAHSLEMLVRLNQAGVGRLMAKDCIAGECARESFERSRATLPLDVDFTAIYSRSDGIVDWRACIDPAARPVEVQASHIGMAVDPDVIEKVRAALVPQPTSYLSAIEVDCGEIA